MTEANINFPKIPFTFEIKGINFERGSIHVKYIPEDTRFTFFEYVIPILTNFDPDNMQEYVSKWAPFDKWFAQEQILLHRDKLAIST